MNLNGKQIVEQGIVTKVHNPDCIQPNGVDLEVVKIERIISSGGGFIPKQGKTVLAKREEMIAIDPYENEIISEDHDLNGKVWHLPVGTYDVTLAQGCKIPANQRLRIVQRSSLLRNGTLLSSSMFDGGFFTDNIGTVIHVTIPIIIEVGARIGQAYVTSVNDVDESNLYNGQWQGDKQRVEGK